MLLKMNKILRLAALALVTSFLFGCSSQPRNPENICDIFIEKYDWYEAAIATRDKWGVPVHVPMAMMYQESSFKYNAQPPMQYWFIFPIGRASDAYGYAQAKTITWDDYVKETGNGWSSRGNFDDAIDFMGWFMDKSQKINGVSKWDAEKQYLNYHEGWGGYKNRSYNSKPWLKKVAKKVKQRSLQYASQYHGCKEDLDSNWLWRLFFL